MTHLQRGQLTFGQGAVAQLGMTPEEDGLGVAFCAEVERLKSEGQPGAVREAARANKEAHRAYVQAQVAATNWAVERRTSGPNAQAMIGRVREIVGATGSEVFGALAAIERNEPGLYRAGMEELREWRRQQ